MIVCLVASAIFQIFPGAFYAKITAGHRRPSCSA